MMWLRKSLNPGDILTTGEDCIITHTINQWSFDKLGQPYQKVGFIEKPTFVVAVKEDGYSAFVISQTYVGWAHVYMQSAVISAANAQRLDMIIYAGMFLLLVVIVLIANLFS